MKTGFWKLYKDGKLNAEGAYKDGIEVGFWTYYNEKGKVLKIREFDEAEN